ncbi:sugar MFS transporter [Aliikangiella coralliicola]|uniref:Sugar MFS transporter n=2 Tax=Aliikangiella coralliicola TaxID=2592383 RepID=A0A545U975_9GAMM|nr:sugar MFS transporter [Aliikangiella coralliicola]
MATLFFLWGFITVLNDLLIPHLKSLFDLNYTQVMLIQFCFFGAYFLISVPAGAYVRKFGYKMGVISGLITAALGCTLFYPAALALQYSLFLFALFVLASGLTILQVSANPYVAALGPQKHASSRLNLAQGLNSLGTTLAPPVGAYLFFSSTLDNSTTADSSVSSAYFMLALTLVMIAIIFSQLKLPTLTPSNDTTSRECKKNIWRAKHLTWGVGAIFFYVGAEVSIGSFLVNYFGETELGSLDEKRAAELLTYYWGGAMVGRFIGSFVTRIVSPHKAIIFNVTMTIILLIITMQTSGFIAIWSVLAIGLFNSIMFPTIFTLGIESMGELTSRASGLLCLAIVGGAIIPIIQGVVADLWEIQYSFVIPAACYLFILYYAIRFPMLKQAWIKAE